MDNGQWTIETNQPVKYSDIIYTEKKSSGSFNSISVFEQERLLEKFKFIYGQIVFDCFSSLKVINNKIDSFVQEALSIDLPSDKVIEIHLELIDNLEHQLPARGLDSEDLDDFCSILIKIIDRLDKAYLSPIG